MSSRAAGSGASLGFVVALGIAGGLALAVGLGDPDILLSDARSPDDPNRSHAEPAVLDAVVSAGVEVAGVDARVPDHPDLGERTAREADVRAAGAGITGGIFQRGEASWYGPGFAGNRTANGEIYDPRAITAAHRALPFGTRVRVTNLRNGRTVVVRINDRGPFVAGRVIDLSEAAAERIGMRAAGLAPVTLEIVGS